MSCGDGRVSVVSRFRATAQFDARVMAREIVRAHGAGRYADAEQIGKQLPEPVFGQELSNRQIGRRGDQLFPVLHWGAGLGRFFDFCLRSLFRYAWGLCSGA